MVESDVELADRLGRKRARMMIVFAVLFLSWQGIYFSSPHDGARTVDHVKIAAWLAWALALLFILARGGAGFRSARVRALMEDEITKSNRLRAYAVGFWVAVGTCVLLYFVSWFEDVNGREAIHIVLSAGVAAALVTFGRLERRALQDG